MQATTQVKLLCSRVTAEGSLPRGAKCYVNADEAVRMYAAGIAEPVSLHHEPIVETAAIEPPENMSNEPKKRTRGKSRKAPKQRSKRRTDK